MKTLKVTQPVMIDGKLKKKDDIIEVDNTLARNLVLRDRAIEVEQKPASDDKKPENPPPAGDDKKPAKTK